MKELTELLPVNCYIFNGRNYLKYVNKLKHNAIHKYDNPEDDNELMVKLRKGKKYFWALWWMGVVDSKLPTRIKDNLFIFIQGYFKK